MNKPNYSYNRKFARSQWRKSFSGMNNVWHSLDRMPKGGSSFRLFTGRCKS